MQRIFTLLLFGSIVSTNAFSQLTCPVGAAAGTSVTYNSTTPQTFITHEWGTTNGDFTYSDAADNYQASTIASSTEIITSPTFTGPGGTLIVGARVSPGNRVTDYTISIVENGTVIACFNGDNLTGNVQRGIAASFTNLEGRRIQIRFTFLAADAGILSFDDFYTNPELTVLPVSFLSFNAKQATASTGSELTWQVGEEDNVSKYVVERNIGNGFQKIGTVPATGQSSYTFVDPQPVEGNVQYRVLNVDHDGQYKYSTILSLKNGVAALMLKVFPLPAQNLLTVQHAKATLKGKISLSTADGRVIKSLIPNTGTMETKVNIADLKAGIYILRFDAGNGQVESTKVIKQ